MPFVEDPIGSGLYVLAGEVEAPLPGRPWATIAEVEQLTGQVVTSATRVQAVTSIELHCGLIEGVLRADVADRDLYWLKLATAYQAAWLSAQPDYLERNAVSTAAQDGQSATMGNADWLTLAPLARKAIKRLSWRGPRSV
ncbi:MAG: hypothetical protein ACRCSN_08490, partial [Dermatophilaceae bacterium]